MTRDDLDLAVTWAAQEGWNPGFHDAECFHAADPSGFFLCEANGEPAGVISAVAYGEAFGFIGFFITAPKYRGQGTYALRLVRAASEHLKGRNVGLDGVMDKVSSYESLGFEMAYSNIRFEGVAGGAAPQGAMDLAGVPFREVLDYDTRFFPARREAFLRSWLAQPGAVSLGVRRRGSLAGYGVLRPCRKGYKIGPLFADGLEAAETIYSALTAEAPGSSIFLDVPEVNVAAVALAERHGMKRVFETARMYNRSAPDLPMEGIFGVTTFELG
jgi:ribosomal protein S18 acetylase RimI-like enzyme